MGTTVSKQIHLRKQNERGWKKFSLYYQLRADNFNGFTVFGSLRSESQKCPCALSLRDKSYTVIFLSGMLKFWHAITANKLIKSFSRIDETATGF